MIINVYRGTDFRRCFQQLGGLRALTEAPIIALTATAPEEIKSSICDSLGLFEPAVISQTLDRPNIFFSASRSKGLNVSTNTFTHVTLLVIYCLQFTIQCDFRSLVSLLRVANDEKNLPKTLIFCNTKDIAVKVYWLLTHSTHSKEFVSMFHASLTQGTKQTIAESFQSQNSPLQFLVATVAFGMVCTAATYMDFVI